MLFQVEEKQKTQVRILFRFVISCVSKSDAPDIAHCHLRQIISIVAALSKPACKNTHRISQLRPIHRHHYRIIRGGRCLEIPVVQLVKHRGYLQCPVLNEYKNTHTQTMWHYANVVTSSHKTKVCPHMRNYIGDVYLLIRVRLVYLLQHQASVALRTIELLPLQPTTPEWHCLLCEGKNTRLMKQVRNKWNTVN